GHRSSCGRGSERAAHSHGGHERTHNEYVQDPNDHFVPLEDAANQADAPGPDRCQEEPAEREQTAPELAPDDLPALERTGPYAIPGTLLSCRGNGDGRAQADCPLKQANERDSAPADRPTQPAEPAGDARISTGVGTHCRQDQYRQTRADENE